MPLHFRITIADHRPLNERRGHVCFAATESPALVETYARVEPATDYDVECLETSTVNRYTRPDQRPFAAPVLADRRPAFSSGIRARMIVDLESLARLHRQLAESEERMALALGYDLQSNDFSALNLSLARDHLERTRRQFT